MSRWNRAVQGLMLVCATSSTAVAQSTTEPTRPLFTYRDALLAGGFVLTTIAIRPLDKRAEEAMQQPERQKNKLFRRSATGLRTLAAPGAVIIGVGMYATGRLANNDRLAQLGLHGTEALFLGQGIAEVMKDFFGRARPFVDTNPDNFQLLRGFGSGDKYHSFPSGHAVAGFAAAAAVTAETNRWWPNSTIFIAPAMYGGAALIGLSRMYDNRHWASDVILGAAVGTFAGAKVVRYFHEHPKNKLDKWLLNASVTPGDYSHISFSVLPAFGR